MKTAVQTVEVREAILDAAEDFLANFGYKKMTIDNLAQVVGIGKGSVYLHFTSKEEIALSHVDRIVERLKIKLKTIAAQDLPAEDRLREMLLRRVMQRFDSVQHYTQSLNDLLAALRPKLLARRKTYFQEEAEIFAEVIAEGQKNGIFEHDDALETAEAFLRATNSLLPYSLTTRELGERDDIEDKTRRLANLLLKGLLHRDK
jgi:AcrR family transcriptional regulator